MKIVYIGTKKGKSVSDSYRLKSFRNVFTSVQFFDYREGEFDKKAVKRILKFKPHIVFINKGEMIIPSLLKRLKNELESTKFFLFYGDKPKEVKSEIVNLAINCDVLLLNHRHDKTWLGYLEKGIKRIEFYPTASDTDIFKPMEHAIIYKVSFAGTMTEDNDQSYYRNELIRKLSTVYSVQLAGGGAWKKIGSASYYGFQYGEDLCDFYSSSSYVLCVDHFRDVYCYTSNRTWNAMACGRPVLLKYFPGCELFFEDGVNVILFKDYNELTMKIRYYDEHPYEKYNIELNARKLIEEKHNYNIRAKELVEIYNRIKNEKNSN